MTPLPPATVDVDRAAAERRPPRRGVLRALGGLAALSSISPAALLAACGRDRSTDNPAAASPVLVSAPGLPSLGAHRLAYNRDGVAVAPLSTAAMATQPSGSTLLAGVGRGVISTHSAPSDSFGNRYDQVDVVHPYTVWPNSGTALYSCQLARGGAGHHVEVAKPRGADETTLVSWKS